MESIIIPKNYKINKEALKSCEQFKTIKDFENFIIEKEKCPDCIAIDDIPFTMEEYDAEGKYISYLNKKLMIEIDVEHENRYEDFKNLKSVEVFNADSYRNDINYLE